MLIDLQLHSTYSDGYLTPTELAKFMAKNGVKIAALTDHNTVGGLDEFRKACDKNGIKAVTGLELYAKAEGRRFNLLWYNFDEADSSLHDLLRDSQKRRRGRTREALTALARHGFRMEIEKILDRYNHYIPINRIVDDILAVPANRKKVRRELGQARPREEEVIWRYLKNDNIVRLKESYISIDRIIKLRKKIGGKLILCHPAKHGYAEKGFLSKMKKAGIDGLETLSPHHSVGAVMYLQQQAREFSWIETGGSDFHRFEGGNYPIQSSYDYFRVESGLLRNVKRIVG